MAEPAAKKARSERATQEQLQCYVNFCREHPQMQTGKNNPNNPQLLANLREEVAAQLNAQRGPTRTATQWKETMALWKYQLRTRARKLTMEQRLTGGGPCGKPLSEFEELALSTFGASAVDGVAEINDLGVTLPRTSVSLSCSSGATSPSNTVVSLSPGPSAMTLPPSPSAISLPPSPGAMSLPPSPGAMSLPPSPGVFSLPPSPGAAPPVPNKEALIQEILQSMRQREERDRARDERDIQMLELLKNINNALNK